MIQADLFGAQGIIKDGKEVLSVAGHALIGSRGEKTALARLGEIQLKQHDDGRWMWSVACYGREGGCGYSVMPKWGKFAESREAALSCAVIELADSSKMLKADEQVKIRHWLEGL